MQRQINADPRGLLGGIRLFMLDMDGTFYLGGRLLPGSLRFLERLRAAGRDVVFVTNNSSKSVSDYREKLLRMGADVPEERIVTSGSATADYLMRTCPGRRVYLMGTRALAREFADAGVRLSGEAPEVVVTAFDTELDYNKLCKTCDIIRRGALWIGTHPDLNCPAEGGWIPDAGSMHALIAASTGRVPDLIIGKPERHIAEYALRRCGRRAGESAMVGDRLYTDIEMAARSGMTGILVLSGEAAAEDIAGSAAKPDLVFDDLGHLAEHL